jgi:phosphohistidine phosphatase
MRLYFLRHAEALDDPDDAIRPLSSHGKEQSREIGRFLKNAGVEFDAAYTSPLVRAVQTAEIVLDACGAARLEKADALLNETAAVRFQHWLRDLPERKRVLLVGHAPSMADRVRGLLSIANPAALSLPKAGLICVDTDDRRTGALKFLITPKALGQ